MRRSLLALAVFALSSSACTAETNPNPNAPAPAQTTTSSTPDTTVTHTETTLPKRGAHIFNAALTEPIGLSADQKKTIEQLLAELPDAPPFTKAIATAVRSGETEPSKIEKIITDANHEASKPLASALTKLHSTLTKEQRSQLVAAVAAHPPKKIEARIGDDEMKARVHEPQNEEVRVKIVADYRAKLDTFVADDFDALAFATPTVNVGELAAKLSKLNPETRDKLANHLEQNAGVRVMKRLASPPAAPAKTTTP